MIPQIRRQDNWINLAKTQEEPVPPHTYHFFNTVARTPPVSCIFYILRSVQQYSSVVYSFCFGFGLFCFVLHILVWIFIDIDV